MLFWHVGATVAAARYAFRDERMDLRFLALGAVLPDLLDTPIGLVGYRTTGGVRLIAHSLLFAAVLLAAVLFSTRRGRPRKRWMPVTIGVLIHLVLDAMWLDPQTLWWPLLGTGFAPAGPSTAAGYITAVLGDWRVWALEAAGLAYLVGLARRAGLGSTEARRELVHTGRVGVPIGLGAAGRGAGSQDGGAGP